MSIARSPWARSWISMQTDKSKPGGIPRDWYGEALMIMIVAMMAILIGYHMGKSDGLADGRRIGEAETWAKYYDQYAKVQWLLEEADLRRMYEKR